MNTIMFHLQHHLLIGDDYERNYVSFVDDDTFPHERVSLTVPELATTPNKKPLGFFSRVVLFLCLLSWSLLYEKCYYLESNN